MEDFEAKFTRGVNLILGEKMSGKSTIIGTIANMLCRWERPREQYRPTVTHGRKRMSIELELAEENKGARCVLLDDPLVRLVDPEHRHKRRFVRQLKREYDQAIVTLRGEKPAVPKVDNVITLPRPG